MLTRRLVAALLTAATAGTALVGCSAGSEESRCTSDGLTVTCAPDQRSKTPKVAGELLTGGSYDISRDRGQVVVVNFWGSWCAPCRAEADDLEATYQATKGSGVTFLGINVQDSKDKAIAFEEGRVTYPSLFDPASRQALNFDIPPNSTPATVVLDRDGRIAVVIRRAVTQEELRPIVEKIAAEQPAPNGFALMGETFRQLAESGPLLLAVGAAALAGLVSFLSPCVLPLMPGYLSYVTGLAGADLEGRSARKGPRLTPPVAEGPPADSGGVAVAAPPASPPVAAVKGRVLAGTMLFIAGFTAVFTATAILFSGVGKLLFQYERTLEIVIGVLVVVLGLGYVGVIPGMQREFRIQRLPAAGLLGAPVLGAVFALSWLPCTGPTLGAVLGMATVDGRTDRAVLLAVAYCLGLGVPFVVFGLGFHRLLGVFRAVRRNSRWVTRIGGALLILIGLALVTGGWQNFVIWLQTHVGVGEVSI